MSLSSLLALGCPEGVDPADTASSATEGSSSSSSTDDSDGVSAGSLTEPSTATTEVTTATSADPTEGATGTTGSAGTTGLPDTTTGTTLDSSTEGDTDGSTTSEEACGDGVIDPGEECDLGADNDNSGECTKLCLNAVCGDGFEQPGEACDEGADNHPSKYNGCTPECSLGPFCGDGVTQSPDEECDPLDPNPDSSAVCVSCKWSGKRVFVSSETYDGDLGGLDGADTICQDLASGAGLTSGDATFRAWLSSSDTSAASRLHHSPEEYILVDGTVVAENWDDLADGAIASAINLDELGGLAVETPRAWTNTTSSAASRGAADCAGWKSNTQGSKGHVGWVVMTDAEWTQAIDFTPAGCIQERRLYCVEQ